MLALSETSVPSITNGGTNTSAIREAIRSAAPTLDSLEEQGELVAAEPGHSVAGPQDRAQPVRGFDQEPVAGVVPEAVVDGLEMVEVTEHQGQRAATPKASLGEQHPVRQQGAVGQPGEGVVHGLMGELRLGLLALGDVLHLGDQVEGLPVLVADRREAERDPDDMSVRADVALLGHVTPPLASHQLIESLHLGIEIVRVRDLRE